MRIYCIDDTVGNFGCRLYCRQIGFLSENYLKQRVEHYTERLVLALRGNVEECHMDEKWFYIRTTRSRRKFLPRQAGESKKDVPLLKKMALRIQGEALSCSEKETLYSRKYKHDLSLMSKRRIGHETV